MTALNLTPVDNNYLTSSLRFQQLKQNTDEIALDTDNFTANNNPVVSTYGDGEVFVNGAITVTGTPAANMNIGSLPAWCVPDRDYYQSVVVMRAGAPVTNYVTFNRSGDSIESINVTDPGSYATLPTVSISAPGSGAVLGLTMKAVSATPSASGTTYAPEQTITLTGGTASAQAILSVTSTKLSSAPAVNARGTGYTPSDVLTLVGGTQATPATVTVTATRVVSATVGTSGGTGGTDGTQTVTGTTGTGTPFQASVTISGGAITAVLSITVPGSYTVNPTLINQPVTGASLVGAQLDVVMGIDTISLTSAGVFTANAVSFSSTGGTGTLATFNTAVYGVNAVTVSATAGSYTVLPANPVAQGSTSGVGTGAEFTVLWGVASVPVTSPGSGYTSASQVTFTGGGGTGGAAADIVFDESVSAKLLLQPTANDIVYLDNSFFVDSYKGQ